MARILAIDYGTKRTGVAVSDPLRIIAGGLETVATKQLERWIASYLSDHEVDTIVVGHPLQTTGEPSATWKYVEPLTRRLQQAHPGVKVVLHDERYTSVLAQRAIRESGLGREKRRDKALVDKVSATIILQSYMEGLALLENRNK